MKNLIGICSPKLASRKKHLFSREFLSIYHQFTITVSTTGWCYSFRRHYGQSSWQGNSLLWVTLILYDEESSSDGDDSSLNIEEEFNATLLEIKENDLCTGRLEEDGDNDFIQNISHEKWEEIGTDIANNTHLIEIHLFDGALDDQKIAEKQLY